MQAEALDQRRASALGLAFGFGGAIAYACSQIIVRNSVGDYATPLTGSMIALSSGTLGFFALSWPRLREPAADLRRGVLLFAVSGIFSALGIFAMFVALEHGSVVVVSPVIATNSLFTLLLAALLLRGLERLTWRFFAGAALVAAGAAVLSVG